MNNIREAIKTWITTSEHTSPEELFARDLILCKSKNEVVDRWLGDIPTAHAIGERGVPFDDMGRWRLKRSSSPNRYLDDLSNLFKPSSGDSQGITSVEFVAHIVEALAHAARNALNCGEPETAKFCLDLISEASRQMQEIEISNPGTATLLISEDWASSAAAILYHSSKSLASTVSASTSTEDSILDFYSGLSSAFRRDAWNAEALRIHIRKESQPNPESAK